MVDWKDKRVIVIGAARQGVALGRFLAARGARVVMNDQKPIDQLEAVKRSLEEQAGNHAWRIEWFLGSHPLSLLEGADVVCVSGGVPLDLPLIQEARAAGIPLSNDSQVFLEECPCRTVGITGSAGKTTTTSLVGMIAETAISAASMGKPRFRKVWVGGNIGSPLLADVEQMDPRDLAVLELSSFQLELMTTSVDIACVLNITPNHLDRHASMDDYIAAKSRILEFQTDTDISILGRDDPGSWALLEKVRGKKYSFGREKTAQGMQGAFIEGEWVSIWDGTTSMRVLRQDEIQLRGWHNVENVLAAITISQAAGLSLKAMREAVQNFSGVAHRLEWVCSWKGADWYNDSIATAPERVIAAIHSFDTPADNQRKIVLLAGGRDKNLPWEDLADLIYTRVKNLILFGEAAGKIATTISDPKYGATNFSMDICSGLEQAVYKAGEVVEAGDIVLLSPGGTSFDEFRDFEDRGEAFKRWVLNLTQK
jgi:UDP-N-acetylmuramoylalanine--D-glutamate ligase